MDFRKNFSERLAAMRKAHNISMAALGDYLSITDEAVRLMERGKRSPSFEVLCALADYFNVSIDYLVGRSDDPSRR
ncbi:MAG: helix-turn-helix transcriptional regulator [Christensenellaceae bacterium]|nr:helix-turn-helix transcriptional regulator [Christensenellaceae bacterium]